MAKLRDGTRIYGSVVIDKDISSSGSVTISKDINVSGVSTVSGSANFLKNINISGMATIAANSGPVLIGTASSNGANQKLQVYGNASFYSNEIIGSGGDLFYNSSVAIGTATPYISPGNASFKQDNIIGEYGTSFIVKDGNAALISSFLTAPVGFNNGPQFSIADEAGDNQHYPGITIREISNDLDGSGEIRFEKAGSLKTGDFNSLTTPASPTATQNNKIGQIFWRAYDGTNAQFDDGAYIGGIIDTADISAGQAGNQPGVFLSFGTRSINDQGLYSTLERLRIASGGAANPGAILIGSATTTPTGTASQLLQVGNGIFPAGAYVSGSVGIGTTLPLGRLQVGTANTAFIVTNTATVGLGTTNPGNATFAIVNTSSARFSLGQNVDGSGTSHLGFIYQGGTSGSANVFTSNGTLRFDTDGAGGGTGSGEIQFGKGLGITTFAVINSTGNIGIGTTNPITKVQVIGSVVAISSAIGIGITNPTSLLQVQGSALIGGATTIAQNLTVSGGTITAGNVAAILLGGNTTTNITFANAQTTGTFTMGGAQTTGTLSIGGANQTGTQSFGISTATQTINYASGVSGLGTTKTINLGANGATGSNTVINIGPTAGVGTVIFNAGNNVGIASTQPTSKLSIIGDAVISGVVTATDFNATSDESLKTNIQPISSPIQKVMQLNGVTFNWKDNNEASVGVIAQEVEKVFPELVHGLQPRTVSYNGLVGLLIECVKEQQKEINELKKRFE